MRIIPVSFSNNKACVNHNFEQNFWYTRRSPKPKANTFEYFSIATGSLALMAVLVTLFNLGSKKPVLKNIFVV